LQTYGALVGVHVNRQKNHRHRIGYVRNTGLWRQTYAVCIYALVSSNTCNTVLLAVVMHFLYHSILPRCFADAAVIRNYRDNHT